MLSFLLSHPLVTFGLAVFLYITIPRLWRAFVRFVVVPAGILGVGFIVVKNPQSFSTAGSFVANCEPLVYLCRQSCVACDELARKCPYMWLS